MVVAHSLKSKDLACIQAVELTEIGSDVVLAHYLNSRDFNYIQAVKLTNRITCRACLLPELKILELYSGRQTYRNRITYGTC